MSHIFVSYSHQDQAYAHRLEAALQAHGFEVWIDDRVDYGASWPRVLEEQLDASAAVIVLMTPRAWKSDWVQSELARAKRKHKPLFPLLLEGDLWLSVEATQVADVRDGALPPEEFYGRLALTKVTRGGLEILAQARMTEPESFTTPTLVGTTLYVRDRKHIMALDLG